MGISEFEISILSLQVTIEFPHVFTQALLYSSVVYSMAAFEWTVVKFLWHFFLLYFTFLSYTFSGMMAAALTANHKIAAVVSVPVLVLWILFSGAMISRRVRTLVFSLNKK